MFASVEQRLFTPVLKIEESWASTLMQEYFRITKQGGRQSRQTPPEMSHTAINGPHTASSTFIIPGVLLHRFDNGWTHLENLLARCSRLVDEALAVCSRTRLLKDGISVYARLWSNFTAVSFVRQRWDQDVYRIHVRRCGSDWTLPQVPILRIWSVSLGRKCKAVGLSHIHSEDAVALEIVDC